MRHKESDLQIRCVGYFRRKYPQYAMLLEHPKNEGNGNRSQGRIAKAEGVQAGVADLILHLPAEFLEAVINGIAYTCRYCSLAIEMKKKGGYQSEAQKLWQKYFEAAGNKYEVCKSFEEFQKIIDDYVANVPAPVAAQLLDLYNKLQEQEQAEAKARLQEIINGN